jgi:hypothetical protein
VYERICQLTSHLSVMPSLFLLLASYVALIECVHQLPPEPALEPNPLEGVTTALRAFASNASTPLTPTGFTKKTYLDTMSGVVDWFLSYQNTTTGAIIDPITHVEEEYATPCWAHAAATLVVYGGRAGDLLGPACLALSSCIRELSHTVGQGQGCASGHCDFFMVPVMKALDLLSPLAPPDTVAAWEAGLKNLSYASFEFPGNNWEVVAATGEYARIVKKGWAINPSLNWTFWEGRIGRLASMGYWGAEGVFLDNIGASPLPSPMAYDAFGSSYPAVLLAEGYNATGVYRKFLAETQVRGLWTRASYQSPLGEQPVGGRSNQHQFAEATLCAVAELYAGALAASGDAGSACQAKRAAALYHRSVRRWVRPDGALQITKNWFLNASLRFGYMSYSFFSNYNTLPMSWLALAYEYAEDGVGECAGIADVGGAAFAVENPNMPKVYASVAGTYVELNGGADPAFDASGFNRFHFDRCDSSGVGGFPCRVLGLLGPSQAPGISGNMAAPAPVPVPVPLGAVRGGGAEGGPFVGGLAMGLVWSYASDPPGAPRRSLANHSYLSILATVTRTNPTNSPASGVGFTTQYVLWREGVLVTEVYTLPPTGGALNVTASIAFPGEQALLGLMAGAAAEAGAEVAEVGGAGAGGRTVFFTPPTNPAAAAAVRSGDLGALRRIWGRPSTSTSTSPTPTLRTFGVSFPVMRFDGTTNYTVAPPPGQGSTATTTTTGGGGGPLAWGEEDALLVQAPVKPPIEEGALVFRVTPPRPLIWTWASGTYVPSRNGLLSPVYAELEPVSNSPSISYSLQVIPWQEGLLGLQ